MVHDDERIAPHETSLLIASRPQSDRRRFTPSIRGIHIPHVHDKTTISNLITLVVLLLSSAGGFMFLPQAQIIQDTICHEYYHKLQGLDSPVDEDSCKVEAISAELAFILAIASTLAAVVGLLATFPWSVVADRVGRKPVLCLSVAGFLLGCLWTLMILWCRHFVPIRLIWLECVWHLLGGGAPTFLGIMLSMLADVTTEEERAVKFMRLQLAGLIGNMLAPSLSSLLMAHYGPWLPMCIGIGLMASATMTVLVIPETATKKAKDAVPDCAHLACRTSRLSQMRARLKDSVSFIRSPSLVLLLIACLVGTPASLATATFMPVFLSKRYGAKLLEAGYVQSGFGGAQMLVLFGVVPWVSRALMDGKSGRLRAADEHHRDLIIARWSAGLMLGAVLVLGLAPTMAAFLVGLGLLALGSATFSMIRSLLSLYVDPKHRTRLFGLVGMVEIVGQIYAQPMLAELFALGMRLGGGWIGLPWFGLAVLTAVVASLLFFVRVSDTLQDAASAEGAPSPHDALTGLD